MQGNAAEAGRLLTAAEVAARTGMSVDYMYRNASTLPYIVRVGRSLRFSESGLEKWIRSRTGR
jgi:predicted DNA-binding transcriptional regulator AlpA